MQLEVQLQLIRGTVQMVQMVLSTKCILLLLQNFVTNASKSFDYIVVAGGGSGGPRHSGGGGAENIRTDRVTIAAEHMQL